MESIKRIARCASPSGDQDDDIDWEDFVNVNGIIVIG
jgi:hypothetical protein